MIITNFDESEYSLYMKAIEKYKEDYNKDILYIDVAFDSDRKFLQKSKSLNRNEFNKDGTFIDNNDLSDFWRIFEDIEKSEEYNLHLNMQYYMEYCQENDYVTPQEWIKNHKHF